MSRSSFLAFAIVIGLSISPSVADAQQQQRRRTGFVNNNTFAPTRFSHQPIPIVRFHANPIYPQTIFLSPAYPIQGLYYGADLGNNGNSNGNNFFPQGYTRPEFYPGTPFRFGQLQEFDAVVH
jgi:hypothetical protein